LSFDCFEKMRVLHVLYEMSRMNECCVWCECVLEQLSDGVSIVSIGWELNKLLQFEVSGRFPPLSYVVFAETLTLTVQTAVETFTLLILQLNVVSSIVNTSSQINTWFCIISPRWIWINNLFLLILSFLYSLCSIDFSFTV